MIIKKYILVAIFIIGLIGLNLLNVFAVVQPETIVSPMEEPSVYYNSSSAQFCQVSINHISDFHFVNVMTLTFSVENQTFDIFNRNFIKSPSAFDINCAVYDFTTGNLMREYSGSASYNQYGNHYQAGFNQLVDDQDPWYFMVPDSSNFVVSVTGSHAPTVQPYVQWSISAPEQKSFTSSLSEPVADDHNAYFILNDKLFWVSYKINSFYSLNNSIENSSEIYSSNGSYSEDGSHIYVEHGTIAWDNNQTNNHTAEGAFATGLNTTSAFYEDISDLSSNVYGIAQTNSDGSITYNSKIYYPISYDSSIYSEPYELCLTADTNKIFHLNFIRNSNLNNVMIDADVYMSAFNLEDGSYIESWCNHVLSDTANKIGWQISFINDDVLESIKVYGCAFINQNNIPVNLANILWQYDQEFKTWRDNMFTRLTQIYNVLSGQNVEYTTSSYPDYGSDLDSDQPEFSDINAEDVGNNLNNAFNGLNSITNEAPTIKSWITKFMPNPLLNAFVIFALALGVVSLIFGKKKSE